MSKNGPKSLTDNDLINRYLETQSESYFSMIYSRYVNKIYSKCLSLLKNDVQAQDATQDIFTKIFLNISGFNQKSRFSTWVYSITYNYCIDYLRRKKKEKTVLTGEDKGASEDLIDEIDDKVLMEMELVRLKSVLEKIPVEDKSVLLMKYREELSIKEISQIFGKTESAIKMKIKRAKHKAKTVYNATFQNQV